MLLPDLIREALPAEFLVAVQQAPPHLIGAACFRYGGAVLYSVRLRVIRTHRRRGIGSALMSAVLAEARSRGCDTVVALVETDREPEAEPFLLRYGFRRGSRLTTVEAAAEPARAWFGALRRRLEDAGKIPETARVLSFAEAPKAEVARLYAEAILCSPELEPGRLQHVLERLASPQSPVAMEGDRVVGALLWSLEGSLAFVHARVVAEERRRGWVNVVLMADALEAGWRAGGRRLRFEIPDGNRDTEKLASRLNAQPVRRLDRYVLELRGRSP
ncbi:MAG: GNAT family N-acetyltransferase [Bryobacterales bacterium]|nr:GNAT family N-acetyltransferase [Bryobacterales bacterium]